MGGEMVTEAFDYDGGRGVSVWVPTETPEAIVYAGDGQGLAWWGALLENADVPATMVVGAHRHDDEETRLYEYTPVFQPDRFDAHEQFFVHDVRAWVTERFGVTFPRERTAVCGVSASGELALAIGLRHSDIYGAIFSSSPGGGFQPGGRLPDVLPRAYLCGGFGEQWFFDNAKRWADALRDAGGDVVIEQREGEHGGAFWAEEFPRMVAWAFG